MKHLGLLLAVLLSACAKDAGQTQEAPSTQSGPKLVGRIASTPADKRFVLIQSYGRLNIEAGTVLTTRGDNERSANLLITGESLGQFAAADVQSGHVEIGDAVYSQHRPNPVKTPVAVSDSEEETLEPIENQPELPSFPAE